MVPNTALVRYITQKFVTACPKGSEGACVFGAAPRARCRRDRPLDTSPWRRHQRSRSAHLYNMPPSRTAPLFEGRLPDGRELRLVPGRGRVWVILDGGDMARIKQDVTAATTKDGVANKAGVDTCSSSRTSCWLRCSDLKVNPSRASPSPRAEGSLRSPHT